MRAWVFAVLFNTAVGYRGAISFVVEYFAKVGRLQVTQEKVGRLQVSCLLAVALYSFNVSKKLKDQTRIVPVKKTELLERNDQEKETS